MATSINRIANPGPLVQNLEMQIVRHKEIEEQATRDVRCKMIQAVALAALFIIAVVGAFLLTSLYAPNYAPIVLFVGTYFLIGHMGEFLKTNFKDEWIKIEKEAEKVQAIAQKHFALLKNENCKQILLTDYAENDETHLQKYTYLAAHHDYWEEDSSKAWEEHRVAFEKANALLQPASGVSVSDKDKKRAIKHAIYAQQQGERALHSKVQAAFTQALMRRPDYRGTQETLFSTHYAPIPMRESEDDLTLNISFFESRWAQNLIDRDLPPYKNRFLDVQGEELCSFLRSAIRKNPEKIVHAFITAMDEQTALLTLRTE